MSARAVVPPSIHAGTPTAHRKRRRISRARPTRATARDENDGAVAVKVWEGGGDGLVRPPDPTLIEHIRARWDASGWDLERRWDLSKELWAHERSRAGLTDDWKFGWHGAKSYVGITYMWGDPGAERGEVFLSKYLMLDPRFDNVLGCLRHELAHALVGPTEDHGPVWVAGVGGRREGAWDAERLGDGHHGKFLQQAVGGGGMERARRGERDGKRVQAAAGVVREERVGGGWDEDGVHGPGR